MSRKKDVRITVPQHLLCSGVAGFTSKTLTAPFDVLKVRTQVGTPDSRLGYFNTISNIYYREGVRGFWKGNLIGCLRLMPYSTIQLIAFHRIRMLLADSCGRINPASAFVAGSGAGLIATLVMYPTDTVKSRLIVQHANIRWAHYSGIVNAFSVILKEEGIVALYRGASTSILGTVPYSATMFFCYELMDQINRSSMAGASAYLGFAQGCLASIIAQTVSFPFDTIRKKMQAYSTSLPNRGGVDIQFNSVQDAFRQTIKAHGIRGLWKGALVNAIKVAPYTGLMFGAYELCKRVCLYNNGYTLNPFQEVQHPLVDQSLTPSQVENFLMDDEDTDEDTWIKSGED